MFEFSRFGFFNFSFLLSFFNFYKLFLFKQGSSTDVGQGVAVDSARNLVYVASYVGTSVNGQTSYGYFDMALFQFTTAGVLLYTKQVLFGGREREREREKEREREG